jgi:rRNA-processing protein FCF1
MPDGFQQKRLAVDSNILFDLAEGHQFAEDFRKTFLAKGYSLEIPPTVVLELVNFSKNGDARERELARITLSSLLTKWKISPISLSSVQRAYTQNFVKFVQADKVLPIRENNDAEILAETSLAGIPILVTSDGTLLDADPVGLALAFEKAGLVPVAPAHPQRLTRAIKK